MIEIDELDYKRLIERSNRLTRAIEYIEKYGKTIEEIAYRNGTCEDSLQEILDILKGVNDDHSSDNN